MPELVEVEMAKRNLSKVVEGKRINKAEVFLEKLVYYKKRNL